MKIQMKKFWTSIHNTLVVLSLSIVSLFVISSCVEDPIESEQDNFVEESGALTRGGDGNSSYYFYNNEGEKVFLTLNTEQAFLSSNKSVAPENVTKHAIKVTEFKAANENGKQSLLKSGVGRFNSKLSFEAKLSDKEYLELLSDIKIKNDGAIVAPYFNDQFGNEIGLSNFFYVKLKSENDSELLKRTAAKKGCVIVKQDAFMPLWYVLSVTEDAELNALQASNYFYESGLFAAAEPDLMADLSQNANDQYYPQQWGLKNTQQSGGVSGRDINISDAWQVSTGANVTVAVIDQGIDLHHPDMAANIHPLSYDCMGGASPQMLRGEHGTACAGIIGAIRNNSTGIAGVAPGCKLMSVSHDLYDNPLIREQLAAGINWAWQNGADVLSNSWGHPTFLNGWYISDAINNALMYGRDGKGCVVVFATGNEDYSVVSYPAALPGVIAVGAMSPDGKRKSYNTSDGEYWWGSNYGNALDVVAPGVLVPTTDIMGYGGYDMGDYYLYFNGTSSACPHVAGLAALALACDPDLRGEDVKSLIESTCTKLPGYSYNSNGWNNEVGYGLVNATALVSELVSESSYWIDTNNVRHEFNAGNTPLSNLCTGRWDNVTINRVSVHKNRIKQIVFKGDYVNTRSLDDYFLYGCESLNYVDLSVFRNVTSIGDYCLYDAWALRDVDLSGFTNVRSIGDYFLRDCMSLTDIDLSAFTSVTSIGADFLLSCYSLPNVDLSAFSNVTSIGEYFLYNCSSLRHVNLSVFTKVTRIERFFMSLCSGLTSINLTGLRNVTSIGNNFLTYSGLTSVDLTDFNRLTSIGNYFMASCQSLTSVDLSSFGNVNTIGAGFMERCLYLKSIWLGGVTWSNTTITGTPFYYIPNVSTNRLYANSLAIATAFKAKVPGVSNWTFTAM